MDKHRAKTIIEALTDIGKKYRQYIECTCPESRERDLAISHIEYACLWAKSAIYKELL